MGCLGKSEKKHDKVIERFMDMDSASTTKLSQYGIFAGTLTWCYLLDGLDLVVVMETTLAAQSHIGR